MRTKVLVPLVAATFILTACATDRGNKEVAGTIIGGIGGAVLGSQVGGGSGQIIATAVGTLAGAFIGNEIGKSLDRADQAAMNQAEQRAHAAPVGQTIAWSNPDSGNSGTVTPVREGRDSRSGATCREYQSTITVDGKQEQAFGTACQQPDGTWKIVES